MDRTGDPFYTIVTSLFPREPAMFGPSRSVFDPIDEEDHRAVKRVTRPMLGFKTFGGAQVTLTGIALIQMHRNGQP